MPLSVRLPGVVGGTVSLVLLALVVTVTGSLTGEKFPAKSVACTVNVYVVSGCSGPKLPDVFFEPCRTGLPFIKTLNHTFGPSSTDDHASEICVAPTSVTETTGLVGGVVSRGSVNVTVLLC